MRVTALLFMPPGRGEFYTKSLDADDNAMPMTPQEFAARSVRAVQHFWPSVRPNKASKLDKCDGGERFVVEGEGWSVEWATEAHKTGIGAFIESYLKGNVSSDVMLDTLLKVQPTERIEL